MARPITAWSHVVTADGTKGRVVRLLVDGLAEVSPYGGGYSMDLPVAELKRIADPRKAKPPIEGMPDGDRPRCAWCGRKLAPRLELFWNGQKSAGASLAIGARVTRRVWLGWSAYEGVFHSMRCALRFAGASYRGGYRRSK